jgi:glutamate dehydrogenase (NAD(P)+)
MMGWMMDEYTKLVGSYSPGVITGKPVGAGGSLGRTEATGYGVVYALREAMKHLGIDPRKTSASLQGFGNVAQYAAAGFRDFLGGTVVAVSCWDRLDNTSYTFAKKDGIDASFLQSITDVYGAIDKAKARQAGYAIEPGEAWLAKEVDVLIPAAIEGQITGETVGQIHRRVRIVAEGANGPTTPDADEVLNRNRVFVIPDFLCNAGGVTVSYFESVQNDMNYYWSRDEVLTRLDEKLRNAFQAVLETSLSQSVPMRDAAYMVAIDRVVHAMQFRGWL